MLPEDSWYDEECRAARNEKNITIAIHTQLAIGCIRNKKKYTEISGDEPKRIAGKAQVNPLINGLWEVFIIITSYLKKNIGTPLIFLYLRNIIY